ncbi:MAG: proline dehydrogenase family protein [Candidatus Parcubacteria bacterium]|nr:proline dehydrogenase family protein [Candidatus Parcubacteria bacterium]
MKRYPTQFLQRAIMEARPLTPTALILRMSNLIPEIQPAFMDLVAVINDVPNPAQYLYKAIHEIWDTLPKYLQVIFTLAEKLAPDFLVNMILRFVVNKLLVPYFLVVDEKSYRETKAKYLKDGSDVILDIVGEEAHLPENAETYMRSYKYVMKTFTGKMAVKPSSLIPASEFEKNTYEQNKTLLKEKFAELFTAAKESGTPIMIDAEEYFKWCKLTEEAFFETVFDERFRTMKNEVGIALQTYRKDAFSSALKILEVARERKNPIRVRVVKGAYWGAEHEIAEKLGVPFPLFETQEETDDMFDLVITLLLKYRKHIHVSPATHNAKHIAFAINEARGDYKNFEFEVLTGMGESIRRALCAIGVPVSVYCPLIRKGGTPKEGMAYLIRRLDEVAKSSHVLKNV